MKTSPLILFSISLSVFGVSGCQNQPTETSDEQTTSEEASSNETTGAEESPTSGDSAELIAELESIAAAVKTDGNGFVTEVDFRGSAVSDDDLQKLTDLKKLQSVLLNETSISDRGLVSIGQIKSLNLDLRDCAISNEGLTHLVGLSNLPALRLSGKSGATTVDDEGMASIGKLTNLKALLLDYLWVSGEGLSQLGELKNLEELYLAGTLIGDEDLERMALFPNLEKLAAKLSQLTGAGLEHVKPLSHLIDLDLSEDSSLFDADLAPLAEMPQLQRLNLWRVSITDSGVAHLQGLTELRWLNLDNTQMTDAGVQSLTGMANLEFLHLGSTSVTDEGIQQLAGLKSLTELQVTRTAVTEDGVEKLKESLPDTKIQLKYLGGE